jgi:hypothetical protein
VLVVCPASLKAEWEEQIARFTDRPAKSVFGPRPQRLAAYGEPVFFNIVNYEQVLTDVDDINAILVPDVVVLDEAQRIKNWQTKTARGVKRLRSPYAFVLTGTPLENRIDELYSIVQYLDPELVGPLFRFNRDFMSSTSAAAPSTTRTSRSCVSAWRPSCFGGGKPKWRPSCRGARSRTISWRWPTSSDCATRSTA